ncbi:MAG: CBS domain-containing protein [Synergistaceae bacterium]|jgi:CBS domain-containing protein|nr:CBS domain-containing protein [Synergistaceae bacterium]
MMLVRDIMERDLTSLSEETPLLEAMALIVTHKTGGLPVLDNNSRVVGFLSEGDVLKAAIPGYLGYMDENFAAPDVGKINARVKRVGDDPARNYMTKGALVFDENETVSNALVALFKRNVRVAPVIKNGSLVGIVNREEILRGFVQNNFGDGEES